jgi:hypothetical protein
VRGWTAIEGSWGYPGKYTLDLYSIRVGLIVRASKSHDLSPVLPLRVGNLSVVGSAFAERVNGKLCVEERVGSAFGSVSSSRCFYDSYLVDPASSICLSQRLSHACLSTSLIKVKLRMAH